MKLDKEQVHFIDNYLKNSGIRYIDIRSEMVDHVASALTEKEGEFYENFKEYMVINKAEMLKSNSHFKKLAIKRALFLMMKNMLKLLSLAVFAGIYAILYILIHNFEAVEIQTFFYIIQVAS